MDTDLGMPIINKEPKTGWQESLASYTKSILFKIGEAANAPLKKSYKKDELAEVLRKTLLSRLEEEATLPEKEWQLLQELADEKLREVKREDLPTYTVLAEHGFAFVFRKGVEMTVSVPEEVIETVNDSSKIDDENSIDMDENEAALLKLYESTKTIYGKANLTHLAKVWNDHHDDQFSVEDVRSIVNDK